MKEIKCKVCGQAFTGYVSLGKHYDTVHPDTQPRKLSRKAAATPQPQSADGSTLSKINQGLALIEDALREVNRERNAFQQKLLELDALEAKYRGLLRK